MPPVHDDTGLARTRTSHDANQLGCLSATRLSQTPSVRSSFLPPPRDRQANDGNDRQPHCRAACALNIAALFKTVNPEFTNRRNEGPHRGHQRMEVFYTYAAHLFQTLACVITNMKV